MSFNSDFDRAFIKRSLLLVQQYEGPYDATLLLNCLLGLLVVPKEACLASIPLDGLKQLHRWGIDPSVIESFGTSSKVDNDPTNLRGLVWRLRNAIAHFHFAPIPASGEVRAFTFHDESGFKATVPLTQLRTFVERLAVHIEQM